MIVQRDMYVRCIGALCHAFMTIACRHWRHVCLHNAQCNITVDKVNYMTPSTFIVIFNTILSRHRRGLLSRNSKATNTKCVKHTKQTLIQPILFLRRYNYVTTWRLYHVQHPSWTIAMLRSCCDMSETVGFCCHNGDKTIRNASINCEYLMLSTQTSSKRNIKTDADDGDADLNCNGSLLKRCCCCCCGFVSSAGSWLKTDDPLRWAMFLHGQRDETMSNDDDDKLKALCHLAS